MNDNELTTLDAVEREIRARYNGKYQSAPEYQASERETRKAITDIFRAVVLVRAVGISDSLPLGCTDMLHN